MSLTIPEAVEQMLQKLAQDAGQTVTLLLGDQVLAEIEPIEPEIPAEWDQRDDGAIRLPGLPGWHFFNWAGYDGYKEPMTQYSDVHVFNLNRLFVMSVMGMHDMMLPAHNFKVVERNGGSRRIMAEPLEDTYVYGVAVKTLDDVHRVFRERSTDRPWRA